VLGALEERRTSEPTLGEGSPGPVTPTLPGQAEWASGDTGPTPCSTQGALSQRVPSTEACVGGDPGLTPRAEVGVGGTVYHLTELRLAFPTLCQPKSGYPLCLSSAVALTPLSVLCVCFFVTVFFPYFSLPFSFQPLPIQHTPVLTMALFPKEPFLIWPWLTLT
jgi:hypothetical protein